MLCTRLGGGDGNHINSQRRSRRVAFNLAKLPSRTTPCGSDRRRGETRPLMRQQATDQAVMQQSARYPAKDPFAQPRVAITTRNEQVNSLV